MERRELLKMIAAATGAAMVGMPALVYGQAPAVGATNALSAADVAKLDEIAETILPRTRTPGAKDAGAGAFMAQFVSDCYTAKEQTTFRAGLADLDKRAGGQFVALTPQARTELLRKVDAEARKHAATHGGNGVTDTGAAEVPNVMPHYFTMIKQLTLFSFFSSKVGATEVLRYVAVPGRYDGDVAYTPGTPAWATG
ncbi:MAG TPA: gluconate 2-dehydrogenase subunit 3 family protein [Stenotrophomonas sp.]